MEKADCTKCIYCNLSTYHRGKWYCSKNSVLDAGKIDIEKCFERKAKK